MVCRRECSTECKGDLYTLVSLQIVRGQIVRGDQSVQATIVRVDRGSSAKAKHSFVRELSNMYESEYVLPLISDFAAVCGP